MGVPVQLESMFEHFRVEAETPMRLIRELRTGRGFATFECADGASFRRLADMVGVAYRHRDDDMDGVTRLRGDQFDDPSIPLPLHTDSSGAENPPMAMLIWCEEVDGCGGASVVSDARAAWLDLYKSNNAALAALSDPSAAIFKSGGDLYEGPVIRAEKGHFEIRLRLDSGGFFSTAAAAALPHLQQALDRQALTFTLKPGQGYALRNDWWLHGRAPFDGTRHLQRVLLSTIS